MSEQYEELSEEELAKLLAPAPIVYYVYFNDDGVIHAITNEKKTETNLNLAELEYKLVENFLSGKANFIDYKIIVASKHTYTIIKNADSLDTGLNLLSFVDSSVSDSTDCIIEWNKNNKCWNFSLQEDGIMVKTKATISFFITLANKNFIVRTIKFDVQDLIGDKTVSVPFISNAENDISKLSVSTRKFFDSYGLLINE